MTDPAGRITISKYDNANRVIQTLAPSSDGLSTVTRSTSYDGLGRKLTDTDEAGVTTAYTYDFRGLLTSVTLKGVS